MNARILIADDEPHMRRVIELSLRRGGYELVIARDGHEAVRLARSEQPALIVMDVNMPELNGVEALRTLKQTPETAAIPVIMLTARGHVLTRHEAESSGAALFLTKPFSPTQLLDEVRRLLPPASATP
ncbi:MAG: response regulator [Verrucomicrobia bacterium]|nr:response regulator [Verrucomicrobiota bacterium]